MTNAETVAYLRQWKERGYGFSWPTDPCGYDQHIRFVKHRNAEWNKRSVEGMAFTDFVLDYANRLEAGEFGGDPPREHGGEW